MISNLRVVVNGGTPAHWSDGIDGIGIPMCAMPYPLRELDDSREALEFAVVFQQQSSIPVPVFLSEPILSFDGHDRLAIANAVSDVAVDGDIIQTQAVDPIVDTVQRSLPLRSPTEAEMNPTNTTGRCSDSDVSLVIHGGGSPASVPRLNSLEIDETAKVIQNTADEQGIGRASIESLSDGEFLRSEPPVPNESPHPVKVTNSEANVSHLNSWKVSGRGESSPQGITTNEEPQPNRQTVVSSIGSNWGSADDDLPALPVEDSSLLANESNIRGERVTGWSPRFSPSPPKLLGAIAPAESGAAVTSTTPEDVVASEVELTRTTDVAVTSELRNPVVQSEGTLASSHTGVLPAKIAAQIGETVGSYVVGMEAGEVVSVEADLRPPELGRLQMRLTRTEDGLQATVIAEDDAVQRILVKHISTIEQIVGAEIGRETALNLSFSDLPTGHDSNSGNGHAPRQVRLPDEESQSTHENSIPRTVGPSDIDVLA